MDQDNQLNNLNKVKRMSLDSGDCYLIFRSTQNKLWMERGRGGASNDWVCLHSCATSPLKSIQELIKITECKYMITK